MDRILALLGMARRAGQTVSGEFSVERAIRENRAQLCIVSRDASDNTKKRFRDKCAFYHVPIAEYSDKQSLGHSMGLEIRTSAAVLDEGFAKAILSGISEKKDGE